jgi:hypothetical protein
VIEDAPVKELERLIAKVDILEPLPPEEVERLALLSSSMRLEAGEAIALDEERETLLLLASGWVRVHKPSAAGPDLTISIVEDGTIVGRAASRFDSQRHCVSRPSNPLLCSSLGGRTSRSLCSATPRWGSRRSAS